MAIVGSSCCCFRLEVTPSTSASTSQSLPKSPDSLTNTNSKFSPSTFRFWQNRANATRVLLAVALTAVLQWSRTPVFATPRAGSRHMSCRERKNFSEMAHSPSFKSSRSRFKLPLKKGFNLRLRLLLQG